MNDCRESVSEPDRLGFEHKKGPRSLVRLRPSVGVGVLRFPARDLEAVLKQLLVVFALELLFEVGVFAPGRFEVKNEVFNAQAKIVQGFLKLVDIV